MLLNVTCIAIFPLQCPALPSSQFCFPPLYAGLTQHPVFHILLSYLNCSISMLLGFNLSILLPNSALPSLSLPPSVSLPSIRAPPFPVPSSIRAHPTSSMIVKSFSPIHQGRPSGMLSGPTPLRLVPISSNLPSSSVCLAWSQCCQSCTSQCTEISHRIVVDPMSMRFHTVVNFVATLKT